MSSQEAAYRLGNLHLMHSTRSVVYLNTRKPDKRFKILKSYKEIEELDDDCTDVFHTNIVAYYHDRPVSLEDWSLYRFASWFTRCSPSTQVQNTGRPPLQKIKCEKHNVWLTKNSKFKVVRFPKFPFGSEEYSYSMLLLLLPHRCETSILQPYESAQEAFRAKQSLFNNSINHLYFSFTDEMENAMRRIRMCENELGISSMCSNDSIDNGAYFDNISVPIFPTNESGSGHVNIVTGSAETTDMHSLECCSMSEGEFHEHVKRMSPCQANVLQYVKSFFSGQSFEHSKDVLHLFISGGAGVGKSFITRMLIAYLQLYTSSQVGVSPVVVCAPTGTAARNINGFTIHSLLQIPVSDYLNYEQLPPFRLSKLQKQFRSVHTIIID